MKATICVDVGCADEALVELWFSVWRERLAYCSENSGCGCCVNMWDVDAPEEAIAELPGTVLAGSDWARSR